MATKTSKTKARRKKSPAQDSSTPDSPSPDLAGTTPDKIRERIQWFHGEKNLDAVRDEAMTLTSKLELTQHHIGELQQYQHALASKLNAVMAHEHYSVVITNVERNGDLSVEVAGLGAGRVQVAVHPDVEIDSLRVGATGLVTSGRNCLLKVTNPTGRWKDTGKFEEYLDADRILVRDRETVVAVDVADCLRDTTLSKGDLVGFDRDVAGMAYRKLPAANSDHLFDEQVTDDFSQLGGLDQPIARIKRHIDFRFRFPAVSQKYGLKEKCGILLEGVPGNGKTRIARCCAGYVRQLFPDRPARFMHIAGSSDYSMWLGESERRIVEKFRAVREAAADGLVIMFWDEVDAIARRRGTDYGSGAADRILNTFLSQIDGIVPLSNVIILYATNRADTLDPGLLRAGRTDDKIEIPTPNRQAAQAILNCYLGNGMPLAEPHNGTEELIVPLLGQLFSPNGNYAEVAQVKLSDGRRLSLAGQELVSGAMLENVVQVAAQEAASREVETGQVGVTGEDLCLALENELAATVSLLAPSNVKSYANSIPQDAQPISVDPVLVRSSSFVRHQ